MLYRCKWSVYKPITLVLITFMLLACSKQPEQVIIGQHSVVLAFGDSLTQGVGTSKERSYPSVLQQKLGIRVINRGVSGETSAQGLARLEQSLVTLRPALVILCFGGNDMLRKLPERQMRENLAQMIEMAQRYQAEVLLLGVPEPSLILSPSPVYEELAEQYQLVADLESLSELLGQPSMKSDAIHLNAKGYAALADALTKKIQVQ